MSKKMVMFDLDGTLADSKTPITDEMAKALVRLMSDPDPRIVAVISGGAWKQFELQFVAKLKEHCKAHQIGLEFLSNLYLLPTCGSQLYLSKQNWEFERVYHNDLSHEEKTSIYVAWANAIADAGIKLGTSYGAFAEDRQSQVTFSMCGQLAPLEVKKKWDPDFSKRKKIVSFMKPALPDFEVRMGGTTSIDVTRKGVDKAYGIKKLLRLDTIAIEKSDILFVGDALFEGGNDYPAKEMGLECRETSGPEETLQIIQTIK